MQSDLVEDIKDLLSSNILYAKECKFKRFAISLNISFCREFYEFEYTEDDQLSSHIFPFDEQKYDHRSLQRILDSMKTLALTNRSFSFGLKDADSGHVELDIKYDAAEDVEVLFRDLYKLPMHNFTHHHFQIFDVDMDFFFFIVPSNETEFKNVIINGEFVDRWVKTNLQRELRLVKNAENLAFVGILHQNVKDELTLSKLQGDLRTFINSRSNISIKEVEKTIEEEEKESDEEVLFKYKKENATIDLTEEATNAEIVEVFVNDSNFITDKEFFHLCGSDGISIDEGVEYKPETFLQHIYDFDLMQKFLDDIDENYSNRELRFDENKIEFKSKCPSPVKFEISPLKTSPVQTKNKFHFASPQIPDFSSEKNFARPQLPDFSSNKPPPTKIPRFSSSQANPFQKSQKDQKTPEINIPKGFSTELFVEILGDKKPPSAAAENKSKIPKSNLFTEKELLGAKKKSVVINSGKLQVAKKSTSIPSRPKESITAKRDRNYVRPEITEKMQNIFSRIQKVRRESSYDKSVSRNFLTRQNGAADFIDDEESEKCDGNNDDVVFVDDAENLQVNQTKGKKRQLYGPPIIDPPMQDPEKPRQKGKIFSSFGKRRGNELSQIQNKQSFGTGGVSPKKRRRK